MTGQAHEHEVIDGLLVRVQRSHARVRDLGDDVVDLLEQPVGIVDVARLDLAQDIVHQAEDLGVGYRHVADKPRGARRLQLDTAVAVLHMHAADARSQLDVHAAFQQTWNRIEDQRVDIHLGQVLGKPWADALLADLLQDGPQHAVCHVVEQRLGIKLLLRVRLEVIDLRDRAGMVLEADGFDAFAGNGEALLGAFRAVVERLPLGKRDGAHRAHPRSQRPGLQVGDGVASVGGELRDVVGMHMPGKDVAHACIGERGCGITPIIDDVLRKNLVLHGEVRHQAVVHDADHRVALGFGLLRLLHHPRQQVVVHAARGDMLVGVVARCGIGAVAARIHGHEGELAQINRVGQLARDFARIVVGVGEVLGFVVAVVAEVRVDLTEIVCRGGLGGLFQAVLEGAGVLVVEHVVVAVDDEHLGVGFVLDGLEALGKLLVPQLLAVFGQVARHHQDVGGVLAHHLQRGIQDGARLLQHLRIAAHVGLVVLAIAHVGKRVVVRIGQDGDLDIGVSRGVAIGIARRGLSGVLRGLVGKCRKGGKPSHRQRQRQRQNRRKRRAEPANDRVFQVIFHPQPLPIVHCDRALERGAFGCEIPERNAVER